MLQRCVFPFALGLTAVAASQEFRVRCLEVLREREQTLTAKIEVDLQMNGLIQEMESSQQSVAEQQQILQELKEEAQKRAEQGNRPLSKKQRRLEYANELLSHNSDLKKQSLIKVINNLNKCGVECTLSTQGKGSHITLSVDGKKHTISSKMEMTHLRDALSDSGVQFSVIEDDNAQSESDQIIQDQTLKVDELTQLLNSLGVNLAELEKEKAEIIHELAQTQESAEEMFEAIVFSGAETSAVAMIIHRSFGRREMIWQIYDAVLADLPHFGPQLDFQRAVKKRLISEKDEWGSGCWIMRFIQKSSTTVLHKHLAYLDTLGSLDFMKMINNKPVSPLQFLNGFILEVFSLDLKELIDSPELYDWNAMIDAVISFKIEQQRSPDLTEFKAMIDGFKIPEQLTYAQNTLAVMKLLLSIYEQKKGERLLKHETVMRLTQDNPNDVDWYTRMRESEKLKDYSFDDLMKISELYDRCNCKIAQAWFDLALFTLARIFERDAREAAMFIEKMLKQTPFQNQNEATPAIFATLRRRCAMELFNQAMDRLLIDLESKQFSETLGDIERAERIYGDGLFKEDVFAESCLRISFILMEIGDLNRAARYYVRGPGSFAKRSDIKELFHRSGFDPKSKEVSRERQKWENTVREQERRMRKERVGELVVRAKAEIREAKGTWDKRDELDLEQIEQDHQQLRAVRNEMQDCVECAIDHPDLLRQLKDKDELYQKCVAFKKGEHSPKKKKTQKRGKRGKH